MPFRSAPVAPARTDMTHEEKHIAGSGDQLVGEDELGAGVRDDDLWESRSQWASVGHSSWRLALRLPVR